MDEIIKPIIKNCAEQIAAQVLAIFRRELGDINKDAQLFCYSEEEAAAKLGVEAKTLYRKRKSGEIDYSRSPSGKPVYLPRHLSEYLERHEIRNGKPPQKSTGRNDFKGLKLAG